MRIKIGILFGGPSREREVSFAGGRTVYDNLNKAIFEPVPVFIDHDGHPILLDWPYIYKGSIRDFYPPISYLPPSPRGYQVYGESLGPQSLADTRRMADLVGRPIAWEDLAARIDMAFLALHGEMGEDGRIQGLLESLGIPYTGSGILPSAFGMDKAIQKKWMQQAGFATPPFQTLTRTQWAQGDAGQIWQDATRHMGRHIVIRPARQGSSIGVSILPDGHGLGDFSRAIEKAFFRHEIDLAAWHSAAPAEKYERIRSITDIREGIGFPLNVGDETLYHPEQLHDLLDASPVTGALTLSGQHAETTVLLESFIRGKEFSCIVIHDQNLGAIGLPPTEIVKKDDLFDYRSKYLPGLSRKKTPIDLPQAAIDEIRSECVRLFTHFEFNCYARIDGFYSTDGRIYLNDPNTTSGMMPSSFFFHQAAEIGLDPSAFLSFIAHSSLEERRAHGMNNPATRQLLQRLNTLLLDVKKHAADKKTVAVILGGYSFERHISVESGRNIYEKLASSVHYVPVPLFLLRDGDGLRFFQLPIPLLLKDNADDIADKVRQFSLHPVTAQLREKAQAITDKFSSSFTVFEPVEWQIEDIKDKVDAVFIALHGRPGEDGTLQRMFDEHGIPYNGSGPDSSAVTINKYDTLQTLRDHGFTTAEQTLVHKAGYEQDKEGTLDELESRYTYPFVGKPVDDGCSSAVVMIRNREVLGHYLDAIFRSPGNDLTEAQLTALKLHANEEFPAKESLLFENKIDAGGALVFMEITTGLLTQWVGDQMEYTIFDPSESLAGSEILSLEEKFLAGEGQNITPARLGRDPEEYAYIVAQIKKDLKRAAQILNISGYARIDAFIRVREDLSVETIIIEVNSLPGMTPATCIFHQAALEDLKPAEFIDRILDFGIKTKESNYA